MIGKTPALGALLPGLLLCLGAPAPCRAGASASDAVAAQIRDTEATNRQLAALTRMKPRHKALEARRPHPPTPPLLPLAHPQDPIPSDPPPRRAGGPLQVGPITITPGGFFAAESSSR